MDNTRFSLRLLAAALAAVWSTSAVSQLALEEVVVTAQKKEESLQDTPIALDAFDESALEREGISNVGDLANNVPAMTIEPFPINSTQLRIYIRGIGLIDAQVTQDPPVGVYIDGAYIARSSGLATDIADLQRIEVLRGPQGTLYGRNSTGGAVNLITKRPNPDELEFKQTLGAGDRDLFSSKTSLNLPLWQGAAAKFAYIYKTNEGHIGHVGSTPSGSQEQYGEFGDKDTEGYRFDFGWDINDWIRLDYAYDYSDVEHTNYAYTVIWPSTPLDTGDSTADFVNNQIRAAAVNYFTYPGYDRRPDDIRTSVPLLGSDTEIEGHMLTMNFSVGDQLEIKYIYAQRDLFDGAAIDLGAGSSAQSYRLDNNAVFSFAWDSPQGITVPRNTQHPSTRPELDHEQFSHELQFSGSVWDGRLDYITGLYYFEEEAVEDNATPHHQLTSPLEGPGIDLGLLGLGTASGIQVLTAQIPTIENSAVAIFTQLTWRPDILDDRLALTLGARHSEDSRKATQYRDLRTFATFGDPSTSPTGTLLQRNLLDGNGDRDYADDSFSFTIEYELNEDTNIYLKRQEAYKSGGFNIREDPSPEGQARFDAGFDEEKVESWELGIKAELFNRRLRINSDVFFTEFVDQQLNFSIPGSLTDTAVANAGTSQLDGFEFDLTFLATEGLVLILNYAYLDSNIDPSVNPLNGETTDQFMFNSAPQHAVTAAFDWTLYYGEWGRLSWNTVYSYTDERNGGGVRPFRRNDMQDDFAVINTRLGLYDIPVVGGELTIAAYVKNLEDTDYVVNAIHNLPQADRAVLWGEPRQYGMEFIYRYFR